MASEEDGNGCSQAAEACANYYDLSMSVSGSEIILDW